MVGGLLASLPPAQAEALKRKYDVNGDGVFDEKEIIGMVEDLATMKAEAKKGGTVAFSRTAAAAVYPAVDTSNQ